MSGDDARTSREVVMTYGNSMILFTVSTPSYTAQGRGSRRSRPMVGRKRRPEGSRMIMRKTSLILLGAAAGVAVTLIATQPRILLDGARAQAAAADTYRQLSLFGDV